MFGRKKKTKNVRVQAPSNAHHRRVQQTDTDNQFISWAIHDAHSNSSSSSYDSGSSSSSDSGSSSSCD